MLKNRLKSTVYVNPSVGTVKPLIRLPTNMNNKNFVLNEVGVLLGTMKGKIDSMLFNVSFISDQGEIGNSEWITGSYFSYVIT